ncbi:C40 family peptidase [Leuconostoc rapi]|uniref:C40 family peptidase n=1 Tax=Leuconostoc rapi TaxID=1406906 RepID=UPI001957144F|nr:NlpC/P60 family protein [Leuconostoc rapi]MBM7435286.1 cell wall-associated NlpC family hydrolase [Leuconostoc rapi]
MSSHKKSRRLRKKHRRWLVIPIIGSLAGILVMTHTRQLSQFIEPIQAMTITPSQTLVTTTGQKATLKTIFMKRYLIANTTQKKLVGFQTIGTKTYYFAPKTGEMVYGLQKIAGNSYYFDKNGVSDTRLAYEKTASSVISNHKVVEKAIAGGMTLVGKSPYVYGGGRTPKSIANNEFDCSSFIAWFYRQAGQPLVVQSAASTTLLNQIGTTVAWSDMQRGDVLVTPDTYSEERLHAAIYLGNGFILHDSAPTNGVAISRLNDLVNPKTSQTLTWSGLFKPGTVRQVVDD